MLGTALVASALGALLAPVARATFPGRNGTIAFVGQTCPDDGGSCTDTLYTAHPDATHPTRRRDVKIADPSYSRSGRRLAVVLRPDDYADVGEGHLAVLTSSGATVRRMPFKGRDPSWSPGGTRIAYEHAGMIYTVKTSGHDRRLLGPGTEPDWSVNGEIAFTAKHGIATMSGMGHHRRQLTHYVAYSPNWSPDGRRLVAIRGTHRPEIDPRSFVFVVGRDGRGARNVTTGVADAGFPVWSPDGRSIAFDRADDIALIRADGSHLRQLHLVRAVHQDELGDNGIAWQARP